MPFRKRVFWKPFLINAALFLGSLACVLGGFFGCFQAFFLVWGVSSFPLAGCVYFIACLALIRLPFIWFTPVAPKIPAKPASFLSRLGRCVFFLFLFFLFLVLGFGSLAFGEYAVNMCCFSAWSDFENIFESARDGVFIGAPFAALCWNMEIDARRWNAPLRPWAVWLLTSIGLWVAMSVYFR